MDNNNNNNNNNIEDDDTADGTIRPDITHRICRMDTDAMRHE